jgi:two-component system response regulator QseB
MRLLLVEDDEALGGTLESGLRQNGYTVDWLTDGQSAAQAIKSENFDIIVLDLGLPKKTGLSVLGELRSAGNKTPVLILTARDSVEDRVKGLDHGADDYLVKPFDLFELCARLRALVRRSFSRAESIITYNDIQLNPAAHSVTFKGEDVVLSRREFTLLQKLLENVGHVISRDHLMQTLYGWEEEVDSNALEVHIHNLRKKFGVELIRTIRGVGYMIDKLE